MADLSLPPCLGPRQEVAGLALGPGPQAPRGGGPRTGGSRSGSPTGSPWILKLMTTCLLGPTVDATVTPGRPPHTPDLASQLPP